jgi:sacsin
MINMNSMGFNIKISFIIKIAFLSYISELFPEIKTNFEETFWFQFSTCQPLPKEFSDDNEFVCSLPCTGVCIKILRNNNQTYSLDSKGTNGLGFCFLPLPKNLNIKFQVNGNFYLTSTREDIVNVSSGDRTNVNKTKWNDFLKKALATTLIECFEIIDQKVDYTTNDLMNIWPLNLDTNFKIMETEFMQKAFDYRQNYKIFRNDQQQLYSINQCKILDLEFNSDMIITSQNFLQLIYGVDYYILRLPDNILEYIQKNNIKIQNKVNKLDFTRFFIKKIEIFPKDEVIKMINYLLNEFSFDYKKSCLTEIGLFLKNSSCIPSNVSEIFKKPNELISASSNVSELYDFDDDDMFPHADILKENEKVLIEMGLINKYLPFAIILERIEYYMKQKHSKYSSWTILNNYLTTLKNEKNIDYEEKIRKIKFIQAKKPKSSNPKRLKWFIEEMPMKDILWSLDDLYNEDFEIFVFRVAPIFDSSKLDAINLPLLNQLFKLRKNELDLSIKQFKKIQSDWFDIDEELKFHFNQDIYKYFLKFIGWLSNEHSNITRDKLELPKNMFFLKINETYNYHNVENIAIEVEFPSNKFMIKLPTEVYEILKNPNKFLLNLGVKEKFDQKYLLELSKTLFQDNKNTSIDKEAQDLSINIIKELDKRSRIFEFRKQIYLPDTNNILRDVDNLCIIDDSKDWLNANKVNIVNDDIPVGLLKNLKIAGLKSHYIKKHMKGMKFGQKEQLKTRIKKLLESYPNLFDIYKELIQNADDCGASEIVFILDERTHGSKKIFSNEFQSLQGPAFCCYNDKTFSENDFEALKDMGMGNKSGDTSKIGKYGVGFNTVYHLTNAPQILSNLNNYIIFDPLCKHFPDLDTDSPGWRISSDKENPLKEYKDVLDSFIGSFKDQKGLLNGTMFRFALRTKESEISENAFTIEQIEENMKENQENIKNAMIFLKNIKKLKVKRILENNEVVPIIDFERKFNDEDDEKVYSDYIRYFKDLAAKKVVEIKKRIFKFNIKIDDQKKASSYRIISQIGFEDTRMSGNLKYFPLGSIAIPIETDLDKFKGSLYCFLPLPISSPGPFHINGYFELVNESRQGLFKLTDTKNEKFFWNQKIFNDIIANLIVEGIKYVKESNEMEYLIKPELIESDYSKYFPNKMDNKNSIDEPLYFVEMVRSFYQKLASSNEELIPTYKTDRITDGLKWIKITDKSLYSNSSIKNWYYSTNNNYEEYTEKLNNLIKLSNLLILFGFKLCTFDKLLAVINNDYNESNKITEITSKNILLFFKNNVSLFGLNIQDTHFKTADSLLLLLEFCKYKNEKSYKDLNGTSLLLNISNKLQNFSCDSPVYKECEYKLFEKYPEKFINLKFFRLNLQEYVKEITVKDLTTLMPIVLDTEKYLIDDKNIFDFKFYPNIVDTSIFKKIESLWKIIIRLIESFKATENNKEISQIDVFSFLIEIHSWAIIPIKFQGSQYLAPLKAAKLIYNKYGIDKNEAVHKDLIDMYESCNLPILEESFKDILKLFTIDLKKIDDILISINLVSKHHQDRIIKIDTSIRNSFIRQLNGLIKTEKDRQLFYSTIMFENAFGEIFSIDDKIVIKLDDKIPIDGLQKIFCRKKYFINKNYSFKNHHMEFIPFYEQHIKSLDVLCYEEKLKHISAIRKNTYPHAHQSKIIPQGLLQNLKNFKFIKSNEMSKMFNAPHFYDSRNRFFKTLLKAKHEVFPFSTYDEAEWQEFLLNVGLKGDSEIETNLIYYLDTVKAEYQSNKIEFNELIYLFNYLFKFDGIENISNHFLNSLQFLIMSIKNNITNENVKIIQNIFLRVYRISDNYFQTIQGKNNQEYLKRLSNFEIIIHKYKSDSNNYKWRLSRIDEFILLGLKECDQIEKLIYTFPMELNEFKDLFFDLGLHKEINYKLCVKLLAKIHDKMKNEDDDKMLLREQSLKVMNLLFKNSPEVKNEVDHEKLYLLNFDYELVETSQLFYIDRYNLNHLYSNKKIKSLCLISLDAFSSSFREYKKYNNSWSKTNVLNGLDQRHHTKPISRSISSELIKNKNFEMTSNVKLENKVKSQLFINSIISLLNVDTHDVNFMKNFFTNIKIWDTKNLRIKMYLNGEVLENFDVEESFYSEFDQKIGSIVFYKNTFLSYRTFDALSDCIVEELSKQFSEYKYLLEQTKSIIIELLASKEENYELIINECKKFSII